MIKPILYHSFEEKANLEVELIRHMTPAQRKKMAKSLANRCICHTAYIK